MKLKGCKIQRKIHPRLLIQNGFVRLIHLKAAHG